MKILAMITILILAVFLLGCAAKEISVAKEAEAEAKEQQRQIEETARQTESTRQQMKEAVSDEPEEDDSEQKLRMNYDEGESLTFTKIDDYRRDRDVTEHCNFDFPFECADSLAKSGVIYLTVKNQDYGSKVEDLTMYMDGDTCDPADTFIEPGQNKEFECYVSTGKGDLVQSSFEIEYYRPIGKTHLTKTGSIVIMME